MVKLRPWLRIEMYRVTAFDEERDFDPEPSQKIICPWPKADHDLIGGDRTVLGAYRVIAVRMDSQRRCIRSSKLAAVFEKKPEAAEF